MPYKRIDLAVSACKKLGRRLVVIGAGSEMENLKKLAGNDKNILFAGRAEDSEVRSYLQRCRALIFCAEEDLGLTPLEVQACGRPVIAFGKGGALETVIDGKTGIFFDKQETDSVASSILEFERLDSKGVFKKEKIISHACQFSIEKSMEQFQKIIKETQEKLK